MATTGQKTTCPVCNTEITVASDAEMNVHLDECLTRQMLSSEDAARPPVNRPPPANTRPPPFVEQWAIPEDSSDEEEEEVEMLSCPICSTGMPNMGFADHVCRAHADYNGRYQCPLCGRSGGAAAGSLLQHVVSSHDMYISPHFRADAVRAALAAAAPRKTPPRAPPAPTKPVKRSPSFTRSKLEQTLPGECVICFEPFLPGCDIKRLECFCVYHQSCIDTWFGKSATCPTHVDGVPAIRIEEDAAVVAVTQTTAPS